MNTSHPGIGFMLSQLAGNEDSVRAFIGSVGKTINALGDDDALHFGFEDGTKLRVFDGGQSCCEHRYMQTDDDLSKYVGSQLVGAEISDGPDTEDEYGEEHEVQFLKVTTSAGVFTMASHNEHNGYYGGISIRAELEN